MIVTIDLSVELCSVDTPISESIDIETDALVVIVAVVVFVVVAVCGT